MQIAKTGRNSACPCGSGKKHKHCCGKSRAPVASLSGIAEAIELLQRGKFLKAEELLAVLRVKEPLNANYHYLTGYSQYQRGLFLEAATAMEKAVELGLSDPSGFYYYGCALASSGRYSEAAQSFSRSMTLKPDFVAAQANLANCFFELQDYEQAEFHYKEVLSREPGNLIACHNLAQVFYLTQRIDIAIAYFERAVAVAPYIAELWASLAAMQEAQNLLDTAKGSAAKALQLEPKNLTAAVALAKVLRRRNQTKEALATLDAAQVNSDVFGSTVAYWAERGQILERLGRYDEAWHAYGQSKALNAAQKSHYDAQLLEQTLASERSVLTADRIDSWSICTGPTEPIPLFIVGFPRSGTTLLEQMLGQHTRIVPCGELTSVIEHEGGKPGYIDWLAALTDRERQSTLNAVREAYLTALHREARLKPDARYASDKMPLNLLRLGLIRLLFPEARIIHVMRHPLDAVISAYFTPFMRGNPWANQISHTAHLFTESWRHAEAMRELPGLHFHRVHYEDLVADPERAVKEVLSFLQLPWEPECLSFENSQRVARTASYAQVAQPIYQTSKNRYRHYVKWIDSSILAMLSPTVLASGYQLDYI